MKLLFVIDSFASGGAQRQMVNLALGLHRRGHQVEFFIYYPYYRHFAQQIEDAHITIHKSTKQGRFSISVILGLRSLIASNNYDIVLSFLDTPNFYAEITSLGRTKPIVVVSERFMYLPGKLPLVKRLQQQFHRLADHITVNSYHQRERMEQEFIWMIGKISTIYNGIDLHTFSPGDLLTQTSQDQLLAVGSIVPKKNIINLIRALDIYRAKYGTPPIINWAGKKIENAKPSINVHSEANQLLANLKLKENWHWLGERSDISRLLKHHNALIHPSFYEGLPNAVCEALASGRPVLASNVCDHPRLLQEGKLGFLFDPRNAEDIANTIHSFVTLNTIKRQEMGKQARSYAEQELSVEQNVSKYEDLFLSMLQKRVYR